MLVGWSLLLSAATPAAHAICPADAAALAADLDAAFTAYDAFEFEVFVQHLESARGDVACLTETAPPAVVARLHVAEALGAWVQKDAVGVVASLRGALAADPAFAPDPALMPEGSRLRAAFEDAASRGGGPEAPLEGAGWGSSRCTPSSRRRR